jgi:biotin synthase
MKVRVSDATAVVLGLARGKVDVPLRTAYFMTYSTLVGGKCLADCSFCTLATSSTSSPDYLSRVRWTPCELEVVAAALRKNADIRRACLQVVNYPGFLQDSLAFLEALNRSMPVSVSVMPIGRENFTRLKKLGADRVAVPMDAGTPELFRKHKGRGGFYDWERHVNSIREAVEVFGPGNVYTYLIVGLGENDEEAVRFLLEFREMGANVALHSFTEVSGLNITGASTPALERYRGIQLARYLVFERRATISSFEFVDGKLSRFLGYTDLEAIGKSEEPYLTTGCPDCSRPFYNERVRGPLYNLPSQRVRES